MYDVMPGSVSGGKNRLDLQAGSLFPVRSLGRSWPDVRSSTRSYDFGESKTSVRFDPSTLVRAGVFIQSGLPGKFTWAIFET